MPSLSVFGSNFEKPLSYLKLAHSKLSYYKYWFKKIILKFGTKMPDLGILGLEFKNTIVIHI